MDLTPRGGTRRRRGARALLALLLITTAAQAQSPKGKIMQLRFEHLAYPATQLIDARLAQTDQAGLLLDEALATGASALRWFSAAAARRGEHAPAPVASFADQPGWDAVAVGAGHWRVVSFAAGSAVAPLVVREGDGPAQRVDREDPRGVFMYPRFVKRDGPRPALTAVDVDADYRITLYTALPNGGYAARRTLPAAAPGIVQDVRMVALANGYLLLVQRFQPGPYRTVKARGDVQIERSGVLEARRLDRQFAPVGAPWRPFGEQAIYAFDADADAGMLVVLASVDGGWRLMLTSAQQAGGAVTERWQGDSAEPLSSPSVLLAPSALYLSALAARGSQHSQLLLASWPGFPAPPTDAARRDPPAQPPNP